MMRRLYSLVAMGLCFWLGVCGSLRVWAEEWVEPPRGSRTVPKALDRFERAAQLVNEAQWESAIAEYQMLIQSDPGQVEPHYRLAQLYQRLRRWAQAAQTAEKAARLDPRNPDVNILWGHALLRQGRHAEAIWVLEGVIRMNTGRALNGVYYDLAQATYAMRWYDRSVDYCLKHLQGADTPQGHAMLARTYLAQGYKDRALASLQRSVSLYESVDDLLK